MTHPTRADEPDYAVTLTIRLHARVGFARIRPGDPSDADVITPSDAIENAIGLLPQDVFDGFGGEFEVALPIEGEATLL